MTNKDKVIIFTADKCDACHLLREHLKDNEKYRFMDIHDPEAANYLQGDEAVVPVAYAHGKFYRIEGNEEGIFMADEKESIPICSMTRRGEDYFLNCGKGERKVS